MSSEEVMEADENSPSSSPDITDDEEENNLELRAKELEDALLNNKFLYDSHVELVGIYEKISDLDSLRDSFKRFSECFPLTPELWLKWIKIEIPLATSDAERENISILFEKATEDYLSVNLWQEYAQFTMDVSDLDSTRKVLEKAVNSAGLHTSDGSLLWDFLREIELASLSVPQEGSEEWKEQVQKVVDVFKRQLSIPLLGMENTYSEWKTWVRDIALDIDKKPVEWGYEKALKLLEIYKAFEEQLVGNSDQNELYKIYKKYIDNVKDPSTIICLYERAIAVAQLCLYPQLWLDYVGYTIKLSGEIALKTVNKSLRNCTWSEELWAMKLRILEHLNCDQSEVLECFEMAVTSISPAPGINLWLTYIGYMNRNEKDTEKVCKLCEKAADLVGEFDNSVYKFTAKILAKNGKVKEGISTFNRAVKKLNTPLIWIEFIKFIEEFGDKTQVRSTFQRALSSCKEHAYLIAENYISFEHEHGNLQQILKCAELISKIESNPTKTEENITENEAVNHNKRKNNNFEHRNVVKKAKYEATEAPKFQKLLPQSTPVEKDPAKTVFLSNLSVKTDENSIRTMFPSAENVELIRDRKGKSRCFAYVQLKNETEVASALARDRELLNERPVFISTCKPDKNARPKVFKYATNFEENKLFVRGLPKSYTQTDVAKLFEPFGATETRIVLHKSGQSKGLAYVDFETSENAKRAMQSLDQTDVEGFKISVALSAPPPKKTGDEKVVESSTNVRGYARSRLQVPLIPRQLTVSSTENGGNSAKSRGEPQKSNEDFRKMLLK